MLEPILISFITIVLALGASSLFVPSLRTAGTGRVRTAQRRGF